MTGENAMTSIAPLEVLATQRARVVAIAELLGPDELDALELVANGLARGRNMYGELVVDKDRRDFRGEAGDELRDSLVYIAAELIRWRRGAVRS